MPTRPKPKGRNDRHGTIQCIDARVVHAQMKSEAGMNGAQ
jgi:hypothetical protein